MDLEEKDYSLENIISRLENCRSNEDEYFHVGECILSLAKEIKMLKYVEEEMNKFVMGFAYKPKS